MNAVPLVLIADMQPHLALAMDHMARTAGAGQVAIAGNSIEAAEIGIDRRPHLAILDIELLPVDGYGLAKMLRDHWTRHNHTGEIWLTAGRLHEPDAALTAESAADRVIRHPFDPNQVADLMRHVLAQHVSA